MSEGAAAGAGPGRPRARSRVRGAARRDEILDAAARLFAERGYHGVTIDDIGAAVGMSGPGIYRHFAGKEDVLAQMLLRISARLRDEGARRVEVAPDAASALEALLRWHVEFSLHQPALITVHGRELGNVPEPARRQVRRLQRLYVEEWVGVLSELLPGAAPARLRVAVHAAIGLLNSTPYSVGRTARPGSAGAAGPGFAGRAPGQPGLSGGAPGGGAPGGTGLGDSELDGTAMADLLVGMARAALLAAAAPGQPQESWLP
jgi:AcrR family transcriptional regulator